MATAATSPPLHFQELAERRRGAWAVLQMAPEAEREQQRPQLAASARPRATAAAPALHGVHQAYQGRQRHAAAAARQRPCRLQQVAGKSMRSN